MQNSKRWYRSKTIWYAIVTGIAGIVAAVQNQYPDIAVLATINSLATILLRTFTAGEIR